MAATASQVDIFGASGQFSQADEHGRYVYLIEFNEPGLMELHRQTRQAGERFDFSASDIQTESSLMSSRHGAYISGMGARLQRDLTVSHHYQITHSGIAARLTEREARQIQGMPEVASVQRERLYHLDTFAGPEFIGAGSVWDGSTTPDGSPYKGEGMIAGVLDSGILPNHPSFANVAACGHGQNGVPNKLISFVDCSSTNAQGLCNGASPVDTNGHGTHVASTVAGNLIGPEVSPAPNPPSGNTISGVAHCAHIRNYKVCPGNTCPQADIQGGMNTLLADGDVDTMNFSISGGTSPWNDNDRRKLDLVDAGVFVNASAGNTSPTITNPIGAVGHIGPWVTSVAASTRPGGAPPGQVSVTGPGTPPGNLVDVSVSPGSDSPSNPGTIEADVRFDPAQPPGAEGCVGFPANFFDGAIALVARGDCPFTDKINNAAAAGAIMVIIRNNVAGDFGMSTPGQAPIPAYAMLQGPGNALRDFIQANPTATARFETLPGGDELAGFSLRGPTRAPFVNLQKPDITGPGVSIYAADVGASGYGNKSGTSMSGPHVSGAAVLVRQMQPDWAPIEVGSAMRMTAKKTGTKPGGTSSWDWDDIGSGRIELTRAGLAGMVMNETFDNFLAANPATGGDLRTLNLPAVRDVNCTPNCSFTRTLRNALDVPTSWSVNSEVISGSFNVQVSPTSFSFSGDLTETQEVTITLTPSGTIPLSFGTIDFVEDDGLSPDLHFTVALAGTGDGGPDPEGNVEGFNFEGTVAGISGADTWASDLRMDIVSPSGASFAVGGFGAGGAPVAWDFDGAGSDPDGTYSSSHPTAFLPGTEIDGNWNLTFTHTYGAGVPMTWDPVTIELTGTARDVLGVINVPAFTLGAGTSTSFSIPVGEPSDDPTIEVGPLEFNLVLEAGDQSTETLTVANIGGGTLDYSVGFSIDSALRPLSDTILDQQTNGTQGIVSTLFEQINTGAYSAEDFDLAGSTSLSTITTRGFMGAPAAGQPPVPVTTINTITWSVFENTGGNPSGNPETSPGNAVWSFTAPRTGDGVNLAVDGSNVDITLDLAAAGESVDLPAGRYWLVMHTSQAGEVSNGRWNWFQGAPQQFENPRIITPGSAFGGAFPSWTNMAQVDPVFTGLSVTITGETESGPGLCDGDAPSWLSLGQTSGSLEGGQSDDIDVLIDTTGLADGDYSTELCLESNDPATPAVFVPVNLTVEGPTVLPPTAVVSPEVVNSVVDEGDSRVVPLTVNNIGDETLEWTVATAEAPANNQTKGNVGPGVGRGNPAAAAGFLEAGGGFATDSWFPAGGFDCDGAEGLIINDNGTVQNGYSGNPAVANVVEVVERFTVTSAGNLGTVCISYLTLAGGPSSLDFEIVVYDADGPDGAPGTLLGSVSSTATNLGQGLPPGGIPIWYSVDMSSANLNLAPGNVYVGGRWIPPTPTNVFLAGDQNSAEAGVGRFRINQDVWQVMGSEVFPDYKHLMVRPQIVEGGAPPSDCANPSTISWLSVSPGSGSIAGGSSAVIDVTLDATGLGQGDYEALICLSSNDPANPLVEIPVNLSVIGAGTGSPEASFDPGSFNFTVVTGSSSTDTLAVGNTGTADLEWSIEDIFGGGSVEVLNESFSDETFPPAGWATFKLAGDGPADVDWNRDASISNTEPASARRRWSTTANGFQDDWLVTPQIQLGDNSELSFFDRGQFMADYTGSFVKVSTASCDPADGDFVEVAEIDDSINITWREVMLDLSAYDNQDICIAFHYTGTFGHTWWVDDVVVTTEIDGPVGGFGSLVADLASADRFQGRGVVECFDFGNDTWLDLNPTSGTVAPLFTQNAALTANADGIPPGIYQTSLCIYTNDDDANPAVIPVTMEVLEEETPIADITPDSFSFEVTAGGSDSDSLIIGNLGNPDLEWDLLGSGNGLRGTSALLYESGPLINQPGAGPAGSDLSLLQSVALGMNTLGAGVQQSAGNRMADVFEVDENWDIDTFTFYVYQSFSPTTSTITGVNLRIWDGAPNAGGTVIFGDTSTNVMDSTQFVDAYRVSETGVATDRPIMEVVADTSGLSLEPGTYWVDVQFNGSLASGPWMPPIAILGETTTGIAVQFTDAGGWAPWEDTGTLTQQGMPFLINGTADGTPPPPPPVCWDPTTVSWLSVAPTDGTVSGNSSQTAAVTVNTSGLATGSYSTTLCVSTNDPDAPLVEVPVSLLVEAATTPPQIDVDPTSIEASLVSGESDTVPLDISNLGGLDLDWSVFATRSVVNNNVVGASGGAVASLDSMADFMSAGGSPAFGAGQFQISGAFDCDGAEGLIVLDDNTIENGYSGNPAVVSAVRFAQRYQPTEPGLLGTVCVHLVSLGPTSLDFDLVVYDADGPDGRPGTLLGSVSATATGLTTGLPPGGVPNNWATVDISSLGILVESGSVYVGIAYAPLTPNVFIASDQSPSTPLATGYWWNDNENDWIPISQSWPDYRAILVRPQFLDAFNCDDPEAVTWLDVSPASGSTAGGDTSTVQVTLDATGLSGGTYTAALCVTSNDPENPVVAVPVTLDVEFTGDVGFLEGVVQSAGYCSANPFPAEGAEIFAEGSDGGTFTTFAAADGSYSLPISEMESPVSVTFSAPDHFEETVTGVVIEGGVVTTVDADLILQAACASVDPTSFTFSGSGADVLTIGNFGAGAELDWNLVTEVPDAAQRASLMLLSEDFEGAFPPAGWSATDATGQCPWLTSDDYAMGGWTGTARGAAIDSDDCGQGVTVDASLVSPALDLTASLNTSVGFDVSYRHLGSSALTLDASTDGSTWVNIETWSASFAYPGDASLPVSFDLSAFDGESEVYLRWRYTSGWDWWAYVDNVVITGDASCYDPAVDTWLSVTPGSGSVMVDESQDVDVVVDASGLSGTFNTSLCIATNDDEAPLFVVPVQLQVLSDEIFRDRFED